MRKKGVLLKNLLIGLIFLLLPPFTLASSLIINTPIVAPDDRLIFTVSPDAQGILREYFIYYGNELKHRGNLPYPENIGYSEETIAYRIPLDWQPGNYTLFVYSYSINDYIQEDFEVRSTTITPTIVPISCSDGTNLNECSITKPKYCDNSGNLVDDCFVCGCPANRRCSIGGYCLEESRAFFTGLATNKKNYKIGEEIKLASSNIVLEITNLETSNIGRGKDFYLNHPLISVEDKIRIEQGTIYPYRGFIIEFKQDPIIQRSQEISTQAIINEQSWVRPLYTISAAILPRSLEPALTSNVEDKIQDYTNRLERKHRDFLVGNRITGAAISSPNEIVIREFTNLFNGIVLDISEEEANALLSQEDVKAVYPNYIVHMNLYDSIPLINADDVWNLIDNNNDFIDGKGIKVAVIDTGIDYTHPDLGRCFGLGCKVVGGYDFINNDNDPIDDFGHGTHVAGIIAADGNIRGVAPGVSLYAYKVLDNEGFGTTDSVMAGIEAAADPNFDYNYEDHLDILSMSLGSSDGDANDPMSKMIDAITNIGVVAVIAAGNDGGFGLGTIASPGTAKKAITVGASCQPYQFYVNYYCEPLYPGEVPGVAWFSSRGPERIFNKPDVVAPGVNILSTFLQGGYRPLSGTSMATPHVAGVVALIKQAHPDWTPYQIKVALKNNAKSFGYSKLIEGAGQIDALKTVQDNVIYPIADLKEGIEEGNKITYKVI